MPLKNSAEQQADSAAGRGQKLIPCFMCSATKIHHAPVSKTTADQRQPPSVWMGRGSVDSADRSGEGTSRPGGGGADTLDSGNEFDDM